jgi:hypothetical protein
VPVFKPSKELRAMVAEADDMQPSHAGDEPSAA